MLKTTTCVINQVIQYFLTSYFTYLTKFWMFQVRKPYSCDFCHLFPVLFYAWNTSINDSFWFLGFFSRNHFLEGGFTFQQGVCFSDGVLFIFKWGGGHWFWQGVFWKKLKDGPGGSNKQVTTITIVMQTQVKFCLWFTKIFSVGPLPNTKKLLL